MYDYFEHCIKISDDDSTISISSIKLFKGEVDDKIVSDLYFKGNKVVQLITNQYGLELSNHYKFDKLYNRLTILDSGSNLNHLKLYGSIRLESKTLDVYDEIYIPIRTDGIYKSLKHSNDSDIINNYYLHDPDIEENSDIFFHDVIPNKLDYKSIGLSTIKYKILNKENKKKYELIKIVT